MPKSLRLLIACLFLSHSAFAKSPLKIVIDPGHGGADHGALRGKVREADIALQISNELAEMLRNSHTVVMTRTSDRAITLRQRTLFAERERADLFISIHANAAEDGRAKGVEFWFQNQLPPDEEARLMASKENQALAFDSHHRAGDTDVSNIIADLQRNHKIQSSFEFSKALAESWVAHPLSPMRNRVIRQAPFYVVSQTTMPSVLVEVGFVSHKSEANLLMQKSHQRDIATQIAKAVERYNEQLPVPPAVTRSVASPVGSSVVTSGTAPSADTATSSQVQ